MNTAEYYHNIFGVSVQELQSLIAAALSKGGDYADLISSTRRSSTSI